MSRVVLFLFCLSTCLFSVSGLFSVCSSVGQNRIHSLPCMAPIELYCSILYLLCMAGTGRSCCKYFLPSSVVCRRD